MSDDLDPVEIRPAEPAELPVVRALLAGHGLPTGDLEEGRVEVWVAVVPVGDGAPRLQGQRSNPESRLIGCVGLEVAGDAVLLRSLAVASGLQGAGLGSRLLAAVSPHLDAAPGGAYLLTTTAAPFFARHGWDEITRSELPAAVLATPEASSLCPESAVVMRRGRRG